MILAGLLVLWPRVGPRVTSAEEVAPQATSTPVRTQPVAAGRRSMFLDNLPKKFELPADDTGKLLLHEYGAVYLARNGAVPPKKIIFRDDSDVSKFQRSVEAATRSIGGIQIELQKSAMEGLAEAIAEAKKAGLTISPRGADSGSRTYEQTRRLWKSRVEPAFKFWVAKGRVSREEATRIQALSEFEQVPQILKMERSGIWFAKSLDKSIIYSVAPPGTSQHLSMLAFDVAEFDNPRIRTILASHGWFQTVVSDLPHFTYIGVPEKDLRGLGLKRSDNGTGRVFWVPDL